MCCEIASGAAGDPSGPEFRASSGFFDANFSSLASDGAGRMVIAWHGIPGPNSANRIYARLYTSGGTALSSEFQVSDPFGERPRVAMAKDGRFMVVWGGPSARLYSPSGQALTGAFLANSQGGAVITTVPASVAAAGNGDFIVAWTRAINATNQLQVVARRFSHDGQPIGGDFIVNPSGRQPLIAANDDGSYIVVWNDGDSRANGRNLLARIFGPDDVARTAVLPISSNLTLALYEASAFGDGNFGITWISDGIVFRHFDPAGAVLGTEIVIRGGVVRGGWPTIVSAGMVGSVVAYTPSDGATGVYFRRYDVNQNPLSQETIVSSAGEFPAAT